MLSVCVLISLLSMYNLSTLLLTSTFSLFFIGDILLRSPVKESIFTFRSNLKLLLLYFCNSDSISDTDFNINPYSSDSANSSLPKYLSNFPYFTGFSAHSLVK